MRYEVKALATSIQKFCHSIDKESSAIEYGGRLNDFDKFLRDKYNVTIDEFVESFKVNPRFDVYDVLGEYRIDLRSRVSKNTAAGRIITTRYFLEMNDIDIINTKWRLKVKPPRREQPEKTPLSKDDIRKIILGCQSPRLRVYLHFLASTGCRASEALSILWKHVDLKNGTIHLRKEYTKGDRARTVILTKEIVTALQTWVDFRNRTRRMIVRNKDGGPQKWKSFYAVRLLKPDNLLFSTGRFDEINDNPVDLYQCVRREFIETMDRIGFQGRRDDGKRRRITLHDFRTFVYSTISGLGQSDFGDFFIGHKHSTYWSKPQSEILKLFHKIEPYLTYLDYSELEQKGADTDSKLEQKDKEIQLMRNQIQQMTEALVNAGILKPD